MYGIYIYIAYMDPMGEVNPIHLSCGWLAPQVDIPHSPLSISRWCLSKAMISRDQSEGFQGDTKRESWMVFMENPINDMGSYLKSELVILDDLFFIYFIFSGCFNEIDTEKSIGTSFEITRKIRT